MAVYIYSKLITPETRDMQLEFNATLIRHFDGLSLWKSGKRINLAPEDTIIAVGDSFTSFAPCRVIGMTDRLPGKPDLYHSLQSMTPNSMNWNDRAVPAGYYGRSSRAHSAMDILFPGTYKVDYVTAKFNVSNEYKLYFFNHKLIRAYKKVVRDGYQLVSKENSWSLDNNLAHPTIRTLKSGWDLERMKIKDLPFVLNETVKTLKSESFASFVADVGVTQATTYDDPLGVVFDANPVDLDTPEIRRLYLDRVRKFFVKQEDDNVDTL